MHRPRPVALATKLGAAMAVSLMFDTLLFALDMSGGVLGLLELTLLAAAVLVRPALRHDRRAILCFGLAAVMAVAMMVIPRLLAWTLFWVFAGLGAMMPGAANFGDAWCWTQRLIVHALRSSIAPWLDLRRWRKVRRRHSVGLLRRTLPNLILPLLGSSVILALFAAANPVLGEWLAKGLELSPDAEVVDDCASGRSGSPWLGACCVPVSRGT